jgi:HAD superfamily hydrolase (TIGR01509 family)
VRVWPHWQPAGVAFDLDGLLVDSEDAWGRAERRVVAGYGRPWDESVRSLLLGTGPLEAAQTLADHLGGVDPAELDRRLLASALEEFAAGVAPRKGAHELVHALSGRVPMAVATNSRRVIAGMLLASAGFRFPVVVCAEDVERPKPAADPYRIACERLGVDPARAVAFEDSPTGVASARAAGLWVVGCPSLPGAEVDGADVVIRSLADVPTEAFLPRPSGR